MCTAWRCVFALALLIAQPAASGIEREGGDVTDSASKSGLVRRPVVAGAFYPGEADALASLIDRMLDDAGTNELDGDVMALVAPHAGYMYSGAVAAHAYAAVAGRRYDTVIVVAPSHRVAFRGASVFDGGSYETPLGGVPVDRATVATLREKGLVFDPRAHAQEHSLEVQVPFLQRALSSFEIVAIVMGEQSEAAVRTLAGSLADAVRERPGRRFLLVASTDLSHYHDQRTANVLDGVAVEAVDAFDPEGLLSALASGECEACGGGPTAAVLMAARSLGADRAEVLRYATSGDVTGDMSQVVGYMAAAVLSSGDGGETSGRENETANTEAPADGRRLTDEERRELLRLARASIVAALRGDPPPTPRMMTPVFEEPSGAFVTLNDRGRLRGCIGAVLATRPLVENVLAMAVEAAFRDPRFPPVREDELDRLDIEISVMSPLEHVEDVSEIAVGRDGLIIQREGSSGLLLPQVATEYGWDREMFLDHTCQKAGLPPGTWRKPGTTILRFSAEVFGEKELGAKSGGDGP
jgi:AmmeMemoRadiSam system protein B/AmmeMemoRadiSam system protein A